MSLYPPNSDPCRTLSVAVYCQYPRCGLLLPYDRHETRGILEFLLKSLGIMGFALESVELALVNDSSQKELNRQYLGLDSSTNILSFPDDDFKTGFLSLSADTFVREIRLFGQPPRKYYVGLLAHGLAHLCGLDHGETMWQVCKRCVAALDRELRL